jgi:hypothetical protein
MKLISSSLSQRKFRVSVEGEIFTLMDIWVQTGVSHNCDLCSTLYTLYFNDTPQTPHVYLGRFADDTYINAAECKEVNDLRKLQRRLSAIETWRERWNIKIKEDKT